MTTPDMNPRNEAKAKEIILGITLDDFSKQSDVDSIINEIKEALDQKDLEREAEIDRLRSLLRKCDIALSPIAFMITLNEWIQVQETIQLIREELNPK